jgi:hypothetical protein
MGFMLGMMGEDMKDIGSMANSMGLANTFYRIKHLRTEFGSMANVPDG